MKPTDQLKEEHRAIETMLSILERMCDKLEAGGEVKPVHLDQTLEFFKIFADKCHHGKEENLLFQAMEKAGFSKQQGPLAVMFSEHTTGRNYVQELGKAIMRYKESNCQDSFGILKPARSYIALLRDHIAKEDNVLFPMAEAHIAEAQQQELLSEFDRVENEIVGKGKHEEFHAVIKELKGIYLI